jgi:hypothetical protein
MNNNSKTLGNFSLLNFQSNDMKCGKIPMIKNIFASNSFTKSMFHYQTLNFVQYFYN